MNKTNPYEADVKRLDKLVGMNEGLLEALKMAYAVLKERHGPDADTAIVVLSERLQVQIEKTAAEAQDIASRVIAACALERAASSAAGDFSPAAGSALSPSAPDSCLAPEP